MSLKEYTRKRNFKTTAGRKPKSSKGCSTLLSSKTMMLPGCTTTCGLRWLLNKPPGVIRYFRGFGK